jgi:hypothetical protein
MIRRGPLRSLAPLGLAVLLVAGACAGGTDDADQVRQDAPGTTRATDPGTDDAGDGENGERAEAGWTELEQAPLALTEVDAAAFDGELWTVGGFTAEGGVTTTVQIFEPRNGEWREGPDLPAALHHASLVATDRHLVVIGGYAGRSFDPVDDVFVLDDGGRGWRSGPPLPAARGAGGAAWDGDRVLFGGGVGPDGLADEVWALADIDGRWIDVGRLSTPRDHLDAASDGSGRTWFLAGRAERLTANLGTVDLVEGDEVRRLGEVPTPRGGVAAFYSGEHGACVAGGERPEATFDEVECIDAEGAVTTLPPLRVPRHGIGADVIDGVAYVALGGPEPLLTVSSVIEALEL